MARKRVTGRSRAISKDSRLLRSLDRLNRKLNILERENEYYSYSSKRLLNRLKIEKGVTYKKSSKQKIRIDTAKLNVSQVRYFQKIFDEFNNALTSSPIGIADVRERTRNELSKSLGELVDKEITQEDVDDFYTLVADEDYRYIADKIGDSELYILITEAREQNYTKEQFVSVLNQYMTSNTKEARERAERLYNKYVSS